MPTRNALGGDISTYVPAQGLEMGHKCVKSALGKVSECPLTGYHVHIMRPVVARLTLGGETGKLQVCRSEFLSYLPSA